MVTKWRLKSAAGSQRASLWQFGPRPARWARSAMGFLLVVVVCLGLGPRSGLSNQRVDLLLVVAIDVSGSVDRREFRLQRDGLATAFRHRAVVDAIRSGGAHGIAVTVVQWSGRDQQHVSVPWTVVRGAEDAVRLADRVNKIERRFYKGITHISGMINLGVQLTYAAPFAAARRVIDVSGDGIDNVDYTPHRARDTAVALGVTVNGLAILNEIPDLGVYYRATVVGGPGAFVINASDYDAYPAAILRKLIREINRGFLS